MGCGIGDHYEKKHGMFFGTLVCCFQEEADRQSHLQQCMKLFHLETTIILCIGGYDTIHNFNSKKETARNLRNAEYLLFSLNPPDRFLDVLVDFFNICRQTFLAPFVISVIQILEPCRYTAA
jgi:hypothetical protein